MRERGARRLRAAWLAGVVSAGVVNAFVPAAGAAARPLHVASSTVWLCRPNQAADPCTSSRAATTVTGTGTTSRSLAPASPQARRFDCFYVYPTVSTESSENADLTVQPAERAAAIVQASRFSQRCSVWAPMYRQVTVAGLKGLTALRSGVVTAYDSLLSAWKDYLAHDNHGRPDRLHRAFAGRLHADPAAADTGRPVAEHCASAWCPPSSWAATCRSPPGRVVGGSFRHIPTCSSATQTGCVIAYSTFGSTPPSSALFGRAGQGVSLQSGQTATGSQQVACVNPVTFSARVATCSRSSAVPPRQPSGVRVRDHPG